MDFSKPHIYRRQIVATGKYYIGKHKGNNVRYKGSGIDWVKDYKKHIKDNNGILIEEILEYVDDILKINEREVYWLEKFDVANNPFYYNKTNKSYGCNVNTKETIEKRTRSLKLNWYKRRLEQGLIIKEEYVNGFLEKYPNFILNENNKHCINYCYNKNQDIKNIICFCEKGIKHFKNYTKGYSNFCSQPCCNLYNVVISKKTKENKGLWDNSKKRLRIKEIEGLTEEEINILRISRISKKLKGRESYSPHTTGKPILQYDLEGNFIKEYPSVRQAGFETNNTPGEPIRKCLKGIQKTAYNFKWKYK